MTRQQAIDAMCRECLYDPHSGGGTWREQITACTGTTCPLYPYRPVSRPEKLRRFNALPPEEQARRREQGARLQRLPGVEIDDEQWR